VNLFQDRHVLLGWPARQLAQARHSVIHARVTGFWRFRHGPFGIKVLIFISRTLARIFVIHSDRGTEALSVMPGRHAASPP
jgi:hypothetical protein